MRGKGKRGGTVKFNSAPLAKKTPQQFTPEKRQCREMKKRRRAKIILAIARKAPADQGATIERFRDTEEGGGEGGEKKKKKKKAATTCFVFRAPFTSGHLRSKKGDRKEGGKKGRERRETMPMMRRPSSVSIKPGPRSAMPETEGEEREGKGKKKKKKEVFLDSYYRVYRSAKGPEADGGERKKKKKKKGLFFLHHDFFQSDSRYAGSARRGGTEEKGEGKEQRKRRKGIDAAGDPPQSYRLSQRWPWSGVDQGLGSRRRQREGRRREKKKKKKKGGDRWMAYYSTSHFTRRAFFEHSRSMMK